MPASAPVAPRRRFATATTDALTLVRALRATM